jgi:hypothetical protein
VEQVLNAFKGEDEAVSKYVCAPCSNCKGQLRDLLGAYGLTEKLNIHYGGLVELIVNAMPDIDKPYLEFGEWRTQVPEG